jgi:nucleoside-diphosphate-sugar epimerase
MRVFIIGGTGFIGSHVASGLIASGHSVSILHRGRRATPDGASSVVGNRADRSLLRTALQDMAPAVVLDMIPYTGRDATTVAGCLPPATERLVAISSGDVYAAYGCFLGLEPATPQGLLDESSPVRTVRYPYRAQAPTAEDYRYDYEKIDVEQHYRSASAVPVTVLRLPMVYGPDDPQHRVVSDADRLREAGMVLRLNSAEAQWRCTRGYVEDVAAAIVLAILDDRATGGLFNVGEPDAPTRAAWLQTIASAIGWRGHVAIEPDAAPSLPLNWSAHLATSTQRIRAELGYVENVGRNEGVRRSLAHAAA